MENYTLQWSNRISEIDKSIWQNIFSNYGPIGDYDFILSVEKSAMSGIHNLYLSIYDSDKCCAIVPCFIYDFDLSILSGNNIKKCVNIVRCINKNFLKKNILFAGTPLAVCNHLLGINENIIGDDRDDLLPFKYPGRDILFEKINLTAKTGELLSILGRIGTGKTTITQLIQRFYTPSEGVITFNNTDINKLDLHKWRRQIRVVSQQTKLFIGTIADNISMFSDSQENVERFCNTMKLEWFFKNEDMKLFNMIDEDGSNLSGGQKQLIGIARALYQSSPILVLDEPTASMDKECEFEVMQLLMRLKRDMIIIMITHKPEIAKLSDKIYILDNKTVAISERYDHLTVSIQ